MQFRERYLIELKLNLTITAYFIILSGIITYILTTSKFTNYSDDMYSANPFPILIGFCIIFAAHFLHFFISGFVIEYEYLKKPYYIIRAFIFIIFIILSICLILIHNWFCSEDCIKNQECFQNWKKYYQDTYVLICFMVFGGIALSIFIFHYFQTEFLIYFNLDKENREEGEVMV